MAVVHVRAGGTKQATGAGDYASTADDWTLANCYDTLLTVGLSTQTGSPSTFIAAGDEIILYDENDTSNPTEHDADFVRLRDISVSGTVTIRSRNGDPDACHIVGSDAAQGYVLWNNNDGALPTDYHVKNLTFTANVTLTGTNDPMFYIQNETGDVIFDNCHWTGCDADTATSTSTLSAVLYNRVNGSTVTTRTVTFQNGCTFNGIDLIYGNGGALIKNDTGGTISIPAGETLTISNVTNAADVDSSGSSPTGIIEVQDGTLTNAGTIVLDTVTQTNVHSTSGINGMINCTAGGTIDGKGDFTGTSLTQTGGRPVAILVHVVGSGTTFEIGTISLTDSTSTWQDTSASGTSAGAFLSQTDASVDATSTVGAVIATRVTSRFGAAAYGSGGGGWHIGRIYAEDCVVVEGVVYSGGDGDMTADSIYITGTRHNTANLLSGETLADNSNGIDVFVFLNPTTGDRNKTVNFNQITITDSQSGAKTSIRVRNGNEAVGPYSLTCNMNNIIVQSNCDDDILVQESAAGVLNLTLVNAYYESLTSSHQGNGTFTNTNPTVGTVTLNTDDTLPAGSDLEDVGTKWWDSTRTPPVGADGEPFPSWDISIGAFQSRNVPSHPGQL